MFIYILKILECNWSRNDEFLLQFVSKERKQKIRNYQFEIDKKLALYGALLIRAGIIRKLNCRNDELIFLKNEHGKPYLASNLNLYFNMSHTRNAVVCGVSEASIGIDIERITDPCLEILPSCFHKEEIKILETHSEECKYNFYKIWTQKEAYTKCDGIGICQDLSKINVLSNEIQKNLSTCFYGDYVYSIYSEKIRSDLMKVEISMDWLYEFFGRDQKHAI